jgi:hypothetical protein
MIKGCQDTSQLTEKPFGAITFSVIKLPDYMLQISPMFIHAYSDALRTQVLVSETRDDNAAFNQLMPGFLTLDAFLPSDYSAYTQNVNYTIMFTPSHTCTPSTIVVIKMPKYLVFQAGQSCTTSIFVADCALNATSNEIVLTNGFLNNLPGGN